MLYTGLTYCGHPLSCAAGVAALDAYADEGLIERSRTLGARLIGELQRLQSHHRVIGDVRGGHGLFAVVELVADRDTREPLAPWPQTPPALKALVDAAMAEGVSFATRGNLILLAPPLVIAEDELADALALLDRLLGELDRMSDDLQQRPHELPADLRHHVQPARRDARALRSGVGPTSKQASAGATRCSSTATIGLPGTTRIAGARSTATCASAPSRWPTRTTPTPRWPRHARPSRPGRDARRRARGPDPPRRRDHGGARLRHRRRARARSRQEPPRSAGEAQETVDFFNLYADDFESHAGYEHELPNDPVEGMLSRNRSVMRPYGVWVVIAPFNFPLALAGGPVAAALVTGNTVVLKGASDTPWAGRLLADCMRDAGLAAGRLQLPVRLRARCRRRAGRASGSPPASPSPARSRSACRC